MKAIIEKELRSYFCTVRGYIFIGVFLLISGYFFITYNVVGGNSDVGVMLENTVVAFVLLIPVLTMGLFAGEKKSGTSSLYLSAPLAKWEIVLGKYIAAAVVFFIAVIINSLSAMVMIFFRGQTFGEIVSVYIGFMLLGMAFISVGMFISALTENQVVAAVLGLLACFTLYLSDWLTGVTSNAIVKFFALPTYYSKFLVGIFDLKAVIYFLSFSAVFVLLTIIYQERIEVKSGKKRDVILAVLCIAASFILINYVADKLSKRVQMTFDMSHNGVFELTDDTEKYLDSMDDNITMYYLAESGSENPYIGEVLARYDRASKKITLKNVDLVKNPTFTSKYSANGEAIAKGSIIVESSKRFTIVEPESSFYVKKSTSGNLSRELGFSLEEKLTKAIDYVLGENESKVYWLTNHGENGYEKPISVLKSENMQTAQSADVAEIVSDADVIVIFAPTKDITAGEDETIRNYLAGGGKLYLILNPGYRIPRLKQIAADYGMTMEDTVLTVDNLSEVIRNNRLYLLTIPTKHKITENLTGVRNLLFPVVSPITIDKDKGVTNLAVTDDKTSSRTVRDDTLSEKIKTGTFTVSAISENYENSSKVILAASSQFLTPSNSELGDILEATDYCNKEFFVNSVKYLLNYKENLTVAPKSIMSRSLNLNAGMQALLTAIFGVALPLAVFAMAFVVHRRRKNR